jgi:hypothetical protein
MPPYYFKEGENFQEGKSHRKIVGPVDIIRPDGYRTSVSVIPQNDPEQIEVSVDPDTSNYVRGRGVDKTTLVFPGNALIFNRRGFDIVNAITSKTQTTVEYREKPLSK